jgi:hypothetical protein
MLIYRGRGVVVAIIAFVCLVLTEVFIRVQFHDEKYYQTHGWPKLTGLLVAAFLVWLLISKRHDSIETGFQEQTETQGFFRSDDSLFLVPVKYWPGLLCLLGVVFYFVKDI